MIQSELPHTREAHVNQSISSPFFLPLPFQEIHQSTIIKSTFLWRKQVNVAYITGTSLTLEIS